MESQTHAGALTNITVLDLTRFLSGPYTTLLLAGLGAEVIKIDAPATGDPTISAPPFATRQGVGYQRTSEEDLGLYYLKRARGKRSIHLDLKSSAGIALFFRLIEQADVLVENFRPGVADRMGIGYEALQSRNPRLVYCAINGYGSSGPDKDLKSFDLMAQAASGIMSITGAPDGAPSKVGSPLSDMVAGTFAALSITAALQERSNSGVGQRVEVSLADCLFSMLMDEPFDQYESLGLAARQGNRIARFSPFNTYATVDGWVALGRTNNREWEGLLVLMEREDLLGNAQFGDTAWRISHNEQVDALVQAFTATLTTNELVQRLNANDLPCAPVRDVTEALAWPQMLERGMVQPVLTASGEPTPARTSRLPFRFSRSTSEPDGSAPHPGADTDNILQTRLGLTALEIRQLRDDGVV